jgi:hypothetical protein
MPRAYRKRVNPDLYRSIAALHLRKDSLKPPTCFCAQCNGVLEFSWVQSGYDATRHARKGRNPGDALRALAAAEGAESLASQALQEWAELLLHPPAVSQGNGANGGSNSDGVEFGDSDYEVDPDSDSDSAPARIVSGAERTAMAMASVGTALIRGAVRSCCTQTFQPSWPRDRDIELRFNQVLAQWKTALALVLPSGDLDHARHLVSLGHGPLSDLVEDSLKDLVQAEALQGEYKDGHLYALFCEPDRWLPAAKPPQQRHAARSLGAGAASGHRPQPPSPSSLRSSQPPLPPRVGQHEPLGGVHNNLLMNPKAIPAAPRGPGRVAVDEMPASLYASRRRREALRREALLAVSEQAASPALHKPAFENATCESSLAELQATALELMQFQGGQRERNHMLRLFIAEVVLPTGPARNAFPSSVWKLEQQGIAVPSRDREQHTCGNCCMIFFPPAQSQAEYLQHWEQKCEDCGLPRFKELLPMDPDVKALPLLVPTKIVQCCSVIEDMQDRIDHSADFEDHLHWMTQKWRRAVKGERSNPADLDSLVGGIWHGTVFQDGMEKGGFMEQESVLPCKLFTDGVQVMGSGAPEVWPVGLVPLSPDPAWRAQRENRFLISVSAGKPKSFDALLHLLVIDHTQRPLILRRHGNRQLWLAFPVDSVDGPAREGLHCFVGHKCCKPCGYCNVQSARFEDHKAMALRGYLVGADGKPDKFGGSQTQCKRRTAASILENAAEGDHLNMHVLQKPYYGLDAAVTKHKKTTGVKGFSAMRGLLGYNAFSTPTCDLFHGEVLDTQAPFYKFLFMKPDDRKQAPADRQQWSLTKEHVKLASAFLQPGFIKWPAGRGRPLADGAMRAGGRRLCGEDYLKFSYLSIYLFDDLLDLLPNMLLASTCLRTSLTLQLMPGLLWRGQAFTEKHDLAYIRTLERAKIPPKVFNPFTGVMHERVAHAREFTVLHGQQVELWGMTTEQAMQDVKKFVPRGSTGSGGLPAIVISSYGKWLQRKCSEASAKSAVAEGKPVIRTLKDFAAAAKARDQPKSIKKGKSGRRARKRKRVVRDAPGPDTPGGDFFLMGGSPVILNDNSLTAVMELLCQHPHMATGYDHSASIGVNSDAFRNSDASAAVEFRGAQVQGTSYCTDSKRLQKGAAGPVGGSFISMLRRGPGGIVEANCETGETRQCLFMAANSPPSLVCLDVGNVMQFVRITFRGVTVRLVKVLWYAPAAVQQRIRLKGGPEVESASKGAGKRPVQEMYARKAVHPPYCPLGGREGDGSALQPQQVPSGPDRSCAVFVSAQHGRLPIVDLEAPCSQSRSWCFLGALYDHALLVKYPTGSLGGSFGQTDLGALAKQFFGVHSPDWRIVLPSTPEMVLRMGLLGSRTSSVLFDKVLGPPVTYAGSKWQAKSSGQLDWSGGQLACDTNPGESEEGED